MPETQDKKQYFVLKEVRLSAFKTLRENTLVSLSPVEAFPLVEAGLILPLYTAIKQKLYPPAPKVSQLKQAVDKLTQKTTPATTVQNEQKAALTPSPEESKLVQQLKEKTKQHNAKSVVFENELRKKIQEKKKAARRA